ncbi:MAG: helix-turn-helix domain-containing protein [Rhodobacteraceae bacterium]|nr:helix-turn-helix domain-containing protein [Paracoccaceae bacterium]MCF8521113.1 helix-turn-helix domain-containing protein [Paracoccaceae bacterium]
MLHTVAKLHYEGDLSQVQIAKQLGLSTATISRLLQRARAEGIVRIEVRDIFAPDELGAQLATRLGLRQVVAVDAPAAGILPALAAPISRLLQEQGLGRDSVLMVGWGRTVSAIIDAGLPQMPGVAVVPSTGGMSQHAQHFQSNEFSRRAAEVTGGTPYFIHAPYLPAAEALDFFLVERSVQESVALWDRLDAAVVGIGLPYGLDRPTQGGATTPDADLAQAAGDVVRHYFDRDGNILQWKGEGRMIAVSSDQLRAAPLVIGVAVGEQKVPSIIGAAKARLINTLVTDTRTAEAVLDGLSGKA